MIVISVLLLAVCASTVNELTRINDLSRLDGKTVTADFTAIEDTKIGDKISSVTVYVNKTGDLPVNTKFKLRWYSDQYFSCGDKFTASVKLKSISDNKYKLSNYANSVYADCILVNTKGKYAENAFFTKVGMIRSFVTKTLIKRFPENTSSILIALNLGDRSYLSDELNNKFRICGVSHLMVVSGLHISIILTLLFGFIEKRFYNRHFKAVSSLIVIFLLCALCGFTQSVIRAGIMFLFFAIAPVFLRRNDPLNSLGAAVVLMLYISPFCIFSVAFLLSVTATVAVVWISPFYSDLIITKLRIKAKPLKSAVNIFTVSITAMICTSPITMYVFDSVSLLSPIAFLLITIPVTFALQFNTLALFLSSFAYLLPLSVPMFTVSGLCARYIELIVNNLGLLDFTVIKANVALFVISVFLIIALILGIYLYKYYHKLLKRRYLSEVKGNS